MKGSVVITKNPENLREHKLLEKVNAKLHRLSALLVHGSVDGGDAMKVNAARKELFSAWHEYAQGARGE